VPKAPALVALVVEEAGTEDGSQIELVIKWPWRRKVSFGRPLEYGAHSRLGEEHWDLQGGGRGIWLGLDAGRG
jgi:hypothetical protein